MKYGLPEEARLYVRRVGWLDWKAHITLLGVEGRKADSYRGWGLSRHFAIRSAILSMRQGESEWREVELRQKS